jgi:uracil-DNA glycosylase family protein
VSASRSRAADGQSRADPPEGAGLEALREAAAGCRACHLWEKGTQTVFGEGDRRSRVMMVGEQPGDREDLEGRPFVGPAGRVLDDGLERAGIDRDAVYVTNIVKHFKWKARGKRRIHMTPSRIEVVACQPWFWAEMKAIQPEAVVLLGAVAAKAVMGSSFRVTRERGQMLEGPDGRTVLATVHPASILRGDPELRRQLMDEFVADLIPVRALLEG